MVRMISITQDHLFLVIGTMGRDVYVYKHNGTQFNILQTINFSTSRHKYVYITNNHQYLTISDEDVDKLYLYSFNNIT